MADQDNLGAHPVRTGGHTVRGFDRDLTHLLDLILEMGERAVDQTQGAIAALLDGDPSTAYRVLDREPQIDYLALDADEEVFQVIARRQPTAIDLRIVLALGRIAAEAERAGDKAARIAQRALDLHETGAEVPGPVLEAVRTLDEIACCAFQRSVAAVAQFDIALAIGVFEDESALYAAAEALNAALVAPGGDPLPASQLAPLFSIAHSLERIGDHGAAIAEQVIYVAEGTDVRFRNREILIDTLRHRGVPGQGTE
jgi:phosphate transport system protein